MDRILVATDFSTRSDRALRRATLLAKRFAAEIVFVHVVDDDQSQRIVAAEERESQLLLDELADTVRSLDGIACSTRVARGEAFEGILAVAAELDPDLVLLGPHRRQLLRDVFIGTTAERTIRNTRWPVLMANGFPTGHYRHLLLPVDFSPTSADAVHAARRLRLTEDVPVTVLHAFDGPSGGLIDTSDATLESAAAEQAHEESEARALLQAFLAAVDFVPAHSLVQPLKWHAAGIIAETARQQGADLIVLGTRGRTGFAKAVLGSVAEETLRVSEADVLAVPPNPLHVGRV